MEFFLILSVKTPFWWGCFFFKKKNLKVICKNSLLMEFFFRLSVSVKTSFWWGCFLRLSVHFYTRSDGPLAEADAWGDDENEYYNDRPDARPPSPPSSSKAPLAEYATPPSNLPVSCCSHDKSIIKNMFYRGGIMSPCLNVRCVKG